MKIQHLIYPSLYIGTWLTILFLFPDEAFYSGTGILRWVVYGLILSLLPFFIYKSLSPTHIVEKAKVTITFASVFLGIPFAIYLGNRAESELLIHGNRTQGIIVKAWETHYKSQQDEWLVQAKYRVGNKYYQTSSKTDDNRTLSEGDTVTVIYSERTPQLSEIQELAKE